MRAAPENPIPSWSDRFRFCPHVLANVLYWVVAVCSLEVRQNDDEVGMVEVMWLLC